MIMIILGHILGHSHAVNEATGITGIFTSALYILALPAVNVYVLISGYFLVDAKWNVKRIVLLWLQVFFYSAVCYGVAVGTGMTNFSLSGVAKALLPISGNQYWFARVFWCFSLFAPFEAMLLRTLSKKQFQFLLAAVLIIFSLWRMFLPFAVTVNSEGGNSILWFFVLFALSAYLKLHTAPQGKTKRYALLSAAAYLLTLLGYFLLSWLSHRLGFGGKGSSLFTEYTSVTIVGMSVGIFMFVVSLPERTASGKRGKLLLFCSGATYSVYLLHENQYVKQWLWDKIQPLTWLGSGRFFLYVAAAALGIFVICTVIDCLMWKQLKRLLGKYDFSSLQRKIDKFMK